MIVTKVNPSVGEFNSTPQTPKRKQKFVSLEAYERQRRVDEPKTSDAVLDQFDALAQASRPDPRAFYQAYRGRITTNFKYPQYVYINDVRDAILFSQRNVSDFNRGKINDSPIDELADQMFIEYKKDIEGWGDGVLDIVDNGDGTFTSVDNRRLLLAKKIGVVDRTYGIWIKVHAANEKLSERLSSRFLGAKTWGEAVAIRVENEKLKGYMQYPVIKEEGKNKESQLIPLSIRDLDLSQLHAQDVRNIRQNAKGGVIYI